MIYRAKGKDIAAAIGITPGRVSQLKREGMPDSSVEAAVSWYRRRVDFARAEGQRLSQQSRRVAPAGEWCRPGASPSPAPHLARLAELHEFARTALSIGQFAVAEGPLREALRAVPVGDRLRVELAADLWTVLTADVVREIQAAMAEDSIDQAQMGAEFDSLSDEEKREMNTFWYSVAAGEIMVADRTTPAGEHS